MGYLINVDGLIDGSSDEVLKEYSVAIENDRFAWIGPTRDGIPERFREWPSLSADGLTMIPGLIDGHVHLCNDSVPDRAAVMLNDLPGAATLRALRNARRTLDMGFTTVRDCAGMGTLALRDAANRGEYTTPRIQAAGYGICGTGGHMDRDRFYNARFRDNPGVADSPAEVRRVARELLKIGADFIKVNATRGYGGIIRGHQEMLTEEMAAAVEVAHKAGRRVASHAMGTDGIRASLDAGVDSVEHGFWLTPELAEQMARQGSFLLPTAATLYRNVTRGFYSDGMSEADLARMHDLAASAREAMFASMEMAKSAGVKIAVGSDMGGGPFLHHGENSTEIEQLVEGGMSPMEAIKAATSVVAELLDRQEDLGQIAPDYLADFVLLRQDPTRDVGILSQRKNIAGVFLDGRAVRSEGDLGSGPWLNSVAKEG
ncbi:MAG: amidohydrolase family protein [Clostridia bacterium]